MPQSILQGSPGSSSEASPLASELASQVGLQTAIAVTLAVTLSIDLQKAVRIGRKTSPNLPSEISRRVTVGFAPQTGCGTGMKLDSRKPFSVAIDTTPGTVLGTVPTVVPGMSI
jgi:hypothetical protein